MNTFAGIKSGGKAAINPDEDDHSEANE